MSRRDIYHVDQTGLGYLIASIAFGAMLGGILMSRAGAGARLPRLMIASAVAWHALLLVFAQMQTLPGGIVPLLIAGVFQSLGMVGLTVILVREPGQRFRGRVMGVRIMAIYSLPVGLLVAGALIERFGFAIDRDALCRGRPRLHGHHRVALARAHVAGGAADARGIGGGARTISQRRSPAEIVHHLVALVGHDEGVAEEDAEQAVGRDRVGLGHDDHAGLEHCSNPAAETCSATTCGLSVTRSMPCTCVGRDW